MRSKLARDPNTPLDVLLALVAAHPEDVLENPALELFLLEDQERGMMLVKKARLGSADKKILRGIAKASKAALRTFLNDCVERALWMAPELVPLPFYQSGLVASRLHSTAKAAELAHQAAVAIADVQLNLKGHDAWEAALIEERERQAAQLEKLVAPRPRAHAS